MNTVWREFKDSGKYHSSDKVGKLSELIVELAPVSEEDWWEKYTKSPKGRTVEQILDIAY